ncbi:MAG: hypothetical protein J5U17_04720 [Candidatus Methanoperedens sp.]|nr:hypothetical protein [Candidatus Methanoperedens sp.]MCE8425061.1 hypothetical protein [Candidatus Methanoperedens sp.]MCE8426813.1 hypothetical protein [Candidatus Methanoperedens sp.]
MKFILDRMLGRLTRWMRLLGYDILYIKKQDDDDRTFLALAEKEGGILISRDKILINKAIKGGLRAYLVGSSDIIGQLREMKKEFDIRLEPEMDRCCLCNSMIRKILPDEMAIVRRTDYVYPSRLNSTTDFWLCENCQQVYWQGKHWENIKEMAEKVIMSYK